MGGEVPAGLPFLKSLLSVDPGIATVASVDAEMLGGNSTSARYWGFR